MGNLSSCLASLIFMLLCVSSASRPIGHLREPEDIAVAIMEMQRANYFAFVLLVKMVPFDRRLSGNVTFLMPNDKILSKDVIPENSVSEFLLRHSISSPLLFDILERIPAGSIIPSSLPNYVLEISNGGRRNFGLNNVKIISPNICTLGSVKCHGISGVLAATSSPENRTQQPSPSCSTNVPAQASPSSSPSPFSVPGEAPVSAPSPADLRHSRRSGAPRIAKRQKLVTLLVVSLIKLSVL